MKRPDPSLVVDRRTLLAGLGAAATLAATGTAARATAADPTIDPDGRPRTAGAAPAFELAGATVADLSARMAKGELTARRIAELYLARIAAVDRPTDGRLGTNAVIEINPEALAIADALDAERQAKGPRGPLHGIPVLIKDNIETADRMQTTAGSLALVGIARAQDAHIVTRLRAAGAVILGKTNLSEWANFRSTQSISGWSGRGGQTRNPYALDRNPCGSSSGTGAGIAADLATLGVGTETDGSIVCPSSICGIVGLKPTLGLLSRSGIVPISHSQDTPGPMCRTVRDAALLLGAMTGVDPRDRDTAPSNGRSHTDYTKFLDLEGLAGKRLGIARNHFGFDPRVEKLMDEAIAALRAGGAEIVDPAPLPHAGEYDEAEFAVLLYEFKADLNAYLGTLGPAADVAKVRTLADLIAWNAAHAQAEMPWFGQELFEQAEAKGPLSDQAYLDALAKCRRLSRQDGIDAVLAEKKLDALVAPSNAPAWLTDYVRGDHYGGGSSTPAAVAGYPTITVPTGFVYGLPIGITFYGAAWSEPKLLSIAYAYEQATQARRAPRFLPTVELG
jgi:amidase